MKLTTSQNKIQFSLCREAENVNPIQEKNLLIELHKVMKFEGKDVKKAFVTILKYLKKNINIMRR